MKCQVKICGITREEDALAAAELGAGLLGFNFWPKSRRYCPPKTALAIRRRLPQSVQVVGVFVNAPREELIQVCDQVGLDVLQLHGDESPEDCANLPKPVVKAIRVTSDMDAKALSGWPVDALLFDSPTSEYGGAGVTFPWEQLAGLEIPRPFWLAGGLSTENVRAAVARLRPDVVDVASGVESAPGVKDRARMAEFIAAVKEEDFGNAA